VRQGEERRDEPKEGEESKTGEGEPLKMGEQQQQQQQLDELVTVERVEQLRMALEAKHSLAAMKKDLLPALLAPEDPLPSYPLPQVSCGEPSTQAQQPCMKHSL